MATVRDLWVSSRTKERTPRWGKGLRYQAVWGSAGRERTKSFARKIDADRHLAVTVTQQLSGAYVDPRSGRITVRQYAASWLAAQLQLRPRSRELYRSHLDVHILPALGDLPIGGVRRSTVQAMVTALALKRSRKSGKGQPRPLAPGTVRSIAKTCSILFRAAVDDQVIAATPCVKLKLPEKAASRAVTLTVAQVEAIAAELPPHLAAFALVGAGCGLRPGELFGLELDPVHGLDMLGRRVRVRQQLQTESGAPPYIGPPKTPASVRDVPLGDEALEALAGHLAAFPPVPVEVVDTTSGQPVRRTARLVFRTAAGLPIRRTAFSKIWTAAVVRVRAAGVELPARVTPHSLRHTYVSLLIADGAHPKSIQQLVGHKGITETMDTYGHLFPDQHDSTRAAIDRAFRKARAEDPGLVSGVPGL